MNNKHTPGPWIVDGRTNLPFRRVGIDQPLRAIHSTTALPIETALVWVDNDAGEFNARLIAAAPDLLAAATQANRAIHLYQTALDARLSHALSKAHETLTEAQAALEAAIAKANR